MKYFLRMAIILLLASCDQNKQMPARISVSPFSTVDKKVLVYTTADSTRHRLSLTDTLSFYDLPQPGETEICVFVDPSKSFQTFMGIGGAITDAAAETFYKLPKDKQQEFLQAYYDVNKGIGYSLARTTIHSSDFSSDSYTYVAENDCEL